MELELAAYVGLGLTDLQHEGDAEKVRCFAEMTANTDRVQQRVLSEILSQNADTEYLKKHNLGGATDREAFKSKIPVVCYEDVRPYICRVADGDRTAILTAQPISEMLISSGTSSGENKLIPLTQEMASRRNFFFSFVKPLLNHSIPGLRGGKALYFLFTKPETLTAGGLIVLPATTSYLKSEQFSFPHTDSFQLMYAQMMYGLYRRHEILAVGSFFGSTIIRVIGFLERHWAQISQDISNGSLSPLITSRPILGHLLPLLKPDPELARFVADECSSGDWDGIIPRLWPNAKCIDAIVTGSMAQYAPMLRSYGGGLPLVSPVYVSSECCAGINIQPLCDLNDTSYVLVPNVAYFEFEDQGGEIVDLSQVELGKEYELLVTNFAGLYRYRMGDILSVAGFHNTSPCFRFQRRRNAVLSVDIDKTDEEQLQRIVNEASEVLKRQGLQVWEYSSCVSTTTVPGHYIIYLEIWPLKVNAFGGNNNSSGSLIDACCAKMEEILRENWYYKEGRDVSSSIGPLEIRVVQRGTFEEISKKAISSGASIGQYKVPRCTKLQPLLDLLDSSVLSTHFSN